MKIQQVELSKLNPAKYNPRDISKDQLSALSASLSKYGFVEPVVVNKRNMVIVGGHQRVKAWQGLGESSVPVVFVDLNEAEERALNLALNRISGEWNKEKLSEVIRDLKGLEFDDFLSTGFTADEVNQLGGLTGLGDRTPVVNPDHVPEEPKKAITEPGDVYELGPHRLICGDSTSHDTIAKLMQDDKAALLFTDPPYGVNYSAEKTGRARIARTSKAAVDRYKILNDDLMGEDLQAFLTKAFRNALQFMMDDWGGYIWLSDSQATANINALIANDIRIGQWIIWDKGQHAPSYRKYQQGHEPCLFVGPASNVKPNGRWYGGHQTTVWRVAREAKTHHPMQKPVELSMTACQHITVEGEIALDLFGGSGSTMVGCHKVGRIARLVEMEPNYCDVIVARMRTLFPELPIKRNGKPF